MVKIILGLAAIVAIIGLVFMFTSKKTNAQDISVYVEYGTVLKKETKESAYTPITEKKTVIGNGSYIKTEKGLAHIVFPDNSVTSLNEQSEIKVEYSDDGISILQLFGDTYNRVKELAEGKKYEVQTGGTLAAVRGTKFAVSYNINNKKTKVAVTENTVTVSRLLAKTTSPTKVSVGSLAIVDENTPITEKQLVSIGLIKNDPDLTNWLERNTLIDHYIETNPLLFLDTFIKTSGDTNTLNGLRDRLEKTKQATLRDQGENSSKGSLKNLLATGGLQKCSYTFSGNGITSSATIYLSAGKMRVDSQTIMKEKTENSHMIFVEKTNYIWGDSMPQGIRMTVPDSQDSVNSIPQEAQMFDMNKEMNYSCSPWSVDDSYFKVPNNIKFMDISQMMNQITPTTSTGGTVDIKTAQCSVCDSLPERDKVQCRQTLGCK